MLEYELTDGQILIKYQDKERIYHSMGRVGKPKNPILTRVLGTTGITNTSHVIWNYHFEDFKSCRVFAICKTK